MNNPPFHVRPYPQQPHRGGKALIQTLNDLEKAIGDEVPDLPRMHEIQKKIHETANHINDDKLVDQLRMLSEAMDEYMEEPDRSFVEKIGSLLLKIRVDLKHL
jgi:hypothetical protein